MKKRIVYLILFFGFILLFFAVQKPCFMFYNDALGRGINTSDMFQVIIHGLSLDAATAGYITAIPWLIILTSIWFKRFPLRGILAGYYILICLIITVIFIGDMCLYPFWNFKLDASVFLYLDSPKNATASVSTGFIVMRIVIILLLSGFSTWVAYKLTPCRLPEVKHKITGSFCTLLLGGILFIFIRGGITESTSNVGQVYFCDNEFLNHSAVNPAFSLLASISKTKNYSEEANYFTRAQCDTLFNGLYPTEGKNHVELLRTKRPNILIILLEGFGATMVESLGGVKGVSPNIDRLSQEGIWFTQCYANSFRTDRGTVCALSGYPSFPDVSVMKIPAKSRTLPSIAKELKNIGYRTDFIYGGDINFTNMKSYLLGTGYQQLTADVDFPLDQHQNAWGVNDDIVFDYLYHQLLQRKDSLWHTTFLTLSSHEPFKVPYHRIKDDRQNAFAYTDNCLGEFIDRIRKTPLWENLLVICLPDHGYYYPEEGHPHNQRVHHIPMLWLGGAISRPMEINTLMNQSDLPATLLGQLDIDHSAFRFSRNVVNDTYTYPFAYWTFGGGFAFSDSTGITLMDINANLPIIEEPSHNENRILRGKAIMQTSYDDLGER